MNALAPALAPSTANGAADDIQNIASTRPRLRCREIKEADLNPLIDLLTAGYQLADRDFWRQRIDRLSRYSPPPGFPKYGYLLDCDNSPVGAIFTVFSSYVADKKTKVRCYLANWFVEPNYRSYAIMLAAHAVKNRDVTYRIGTPSEHSLPILLALGYQKYCNGRFICLPALSWRSERVRVERYDPHRPGSPGITSAEDKIFLAHAEYGCIGLICLAAGREYPFVFQPRRKGGIVPFARLVYCRDLDDFTRFAGPLGRFLLARGFPLVALDTNAPVSGLIGRYSDRFPKYFKGTDQPTLADSAYSARVIFDF
jgi:hypothetical protein